MTALARNFPHMRLEEHLRLERCSTSQDLDRKDKLDDYRALPSLQEYVLVHEELACVEIFRRRANWEGESFEAVSSITPESVNVTVPIADFYRRVRF